jgi:hypothetical protein
MARLLRHRLLVFSPEPGGNGFLDVAERFLLILALGNTSRQGRAFGNHSTVFHLGETIEGKQKALIANVQSGNVDDPLL